MPRSPSLGDPLVDNPLPREAKAPSCVIEIENLSLTFKTEKQDVAALRDISLSVPSGGFVSLIGPSGCGKTTLLRIIAALQTWDQGRIQINGVPPQQARRARQMGYVFQAAALLPWRNIWRNVALPLELAGTPKATAKDTAYAMLARVGLQGFETRRPWQLSGGMQQRVSIARALSFAPKLLLMDEPFGALDEITREHLNGELLKLWRANAASIVFVTHSIAEAVFLSTKIVVMSPRPGRIVQIIDNPAPATRDLSFRETPQALALTQQVRAALNASPADLAPLEGAAPPEGTG